MKVLLLPRLLLMIATVTLMACAAPAPHLAVYEEAAFAPFGVRGTGTVTGHVANPEGGSPSDQVVQLIPANAYTREIIERVFGRSEKLKPADPRAARYTREAKTDRAGNFVFRELAPGNYYVACLITWSDGVFNATNADGSSTFWPTYRSQWNFARLTVQNGQTARVQEWQKGP